MGKRAASETAGPEKKGRHAKRPFTQNIHTAVKPPTPPVINRSQIRITQWNGMETVYPTMNLLEKLQLMDFPSYPARK